MAWSEDWEARTASLFELWHLCESDGAEHCPALLERIRACRPLADSAPVPEIRELSKRFLDEIWNASRSLLYGDLEPALNHLSEARRLDREIRSASPALRWDREE